MPDDHSQHRKRVKDEFRRHGMEHFPPHKKLELFLYLVIPRRDTNPVAHRLIDRFGSLAGVFDAPYELLLEVEGVGEEAATGIKLMSAMNREYMIDAYSTHDMIKTCEDAKEYFRYRFLSDRVECVFLACLSFSGKLIQCHHIAKGTLEKVEILPSDVVKACLRADAAKAILAHNHPGGFCNPSRKDLNTTYLLNQELKRVDVELLDHIIVASDGVYSMKESNMFPTGDP